MSFEAQIELHSRKCSCGGGSWVLLGGASGSPCAGGAGEGEAQQKVLALAEWKQLGKPGSVESYQEALERETGGERREFKRFEVNLAARIARVPTWREPAPQSEETTAEVIAAGGALVRSLMAVEKGEIIEFSLAGGNGKGDGFRTRSEVMYVSTGRGPGLDGVQRLGLKFLDAPLPDSFIPPGALPLP